MELRPALEHGSTRGGRWLRERRLRFALWIAVVEGLLVVFDVIPSAVAIVAVLGTLAFYWFVGRRLAADSGRQASWIAAVSQLFVALVPVLLFVLTTLAVIALAVLVLVALIALFADRR